MLRATLQRAQRAVVRRQGPAAAAVAPSRMAYFSTDDAKPEDTPKAAEPTQEEKDAHRHEWGIKYDDEALKFEKEWQEIASRVEKEQSVYLESELSDLQKKKVDMLADKIIDLNIFETRYMAASISQRLERTSGLSPMKLNLDWPSIKQDSTGTWPPANPNWFKQQDLMSQLGPFMGSMGMGGGGGGGAPAAEGAGAAAAQEEAKPVEEKTHFDIELSAFDPASKIKVIKEVRAMFGLGLKEAKEMVEGAPVWIKKEVAKAEAEEIIEKLKSVGGELRMA